MSRAWCSDELGAQVVREIAGEGGRTIASVSASQWSAGPEEWWAGWAGTAGIIPPPRGEEGFRSESAETRGAARRAAQRQEW